MHYYVHYFSCKLLTEVWAMNFPLCVQTVLSCSSLRSQSIKATGLHLQQPVLPVSSWDTEVMNGASQDEERFSLQSELRRVGSQALHTVHSSCFRVVPKRQNFETVKELAEKEKENC